MCGIVAVVEGEAPNEQLLLEMSSALRHRGPDDAGLLCLPERGVGLAMRRLSIIDHVGGRQPMWSDDHRAVLVFNGEIYNASELRADLESRGRVFTSDHSDTEVVVNGYAEWGTGVFRRLNGMFAIAVWDEDRRRLVVARDIAGEKPLYIAAVPGGFAVGSELKALLVHPGVDREIDPEAIAQYLSFDYILAPRSPFRSVQKLPAGHWAAITPRDVRATRYWAPDVRTQTDVDPEELDQLLSDAVRRRMVADVPIGLFLSGGLDSTTVGHYMRRHSESVQSFAIAFEQDAFDESRFAQAAADALGVDHHVEVLSEAKACEIVGGLADVLDEPMADQSIIPTLLLSRFAARSVTVALGGDGSDELFMGYRTLKPLKLAWMLDRVGGVNRGIAAMTRRLPESVGSVRLRPIEFGRLLQLRPEERMLSELGSFRGLGVSLLSSDLRSQVSPSVVAAAGRSLTADLAPGHGAADATVAAYFHGYLQDDILVKVDRASMSASLEVRAPFLDPHVIDFALRLPHNAKLRGFTGKHILRKVMRTRIPSEIIDRRKSGFAAPVDRWLRGPIDPLVRELLEPRLRERDGLYDPDALARLLARHRAGHSVGRQIWALVVLELWRDRWLAA